MKFIGHLISYPSFKRATFANSSNKKPRRWGTRRQGFYSTTWRDCRDFPSCSCLQIRAPNRDSKLNNLHLANPPTRHGSVAGRGSMREPTPGNGVWRVGQKIPAAFQQRGKVLRAAHGLYPLVQHARPQDRTNKLVPIGKRNPPLYSSGDEFEAICGLR
jgi:hypothetical protein